MLTAALASALTGVFTAVSARASGAATELSAQSATKAPNHTPNRPGARAVYMCVTERATKGVGKGRTKASIGRRAMARTAAVAVALPVASSAVLGLGPGAAGKPAYADQVRDRQLPALQSLGALQAQQKTNGRGATVAVVDSGVDADHPDLAGSVVTGPDYTKGSNPPGVAPVRLHGTFMASLVAGHGHGPGKGDGVVGVAPGARILAIRVAPEREDPGFFTFNTQRRYRNAVAKGIRRAADQGADVINLSLGKGDATPEERAAITHAISKGAVVVAAAGNDGQSSKVDAEGYAPYSYPAAIPGVVSVAAVDANKRHAGFSNRNSSVLVAAPGVEIVGAGPNNRYLVGDGTSQATALVSGVAALIRSRHPKMSPALVSQAIVASTANRPTAGYDERVGFGIVNAERALAEADKLAGYKNRGGLPGTRRMGGSEAGPVEVVDRDLVRIGGFGGAAVLAVLGFVASVIVMMSLSRRMRRPAATGPYPATTAPPVIGAGPPVGLPAGPHPGPGPVDPRPI